MKRFWIMALVLIMAVTFFGCAEQESVYTVEKNGSAFLVDADNQIISADGNTYRYDFSGDSSSFNITITYPDGSTYWYSQSDGAGYGGWSDDYGKGNYPSGDTLVDVVQERAPKRVNVRNIAFALIIIALGIFEVACPEAAWYLSRGWQYKNAEPSEAALGFARVGGVVAVILGIVLLLS